MLRERLRFTVTAMPRLSPIAGGLVLLGGIGALAASSEPGAAFAASCFALSGGALVMIDLPWKRLLHGWVIATAAAIGACAVLMLADFGGTAGADYQQPGRMSLISGFGFLLLACALPAPWRGEVRERVSQWVTGYALIFMSIAGLAASLVASRVLYVWPGSMGVATATTTGFVLLGLGLLSRRLPEHVPSQDIPITRSAALLVALTGASVGLAAYGSLLAQVQLQLARSLAGTLDGAVRRMEKQVSGELSDPEGNTAAGTQNLKYRECRPAPVGHFCLDSGGISSVGWIFDREMDLGGITVGRLSAPGIGARLAALKAAGPAESLAVVEEDVWPMLYPLTLQGQWGAVAIALVAAGGAWMVHRRVKPLTMALERQVRERTAALELASLGLSKSERRFGQVVEAAPSAMVMVNQRGDIVLVNAQAERIFGYGREELLGRSVEILVPERHRDAHVTFRNEFHAHPATRQMGKGRELYGIRKDGTEFPVEIGLNPIEMEEGLFVLSDILDITERRAAQRQIELALQEKTVLLNEVHHRVKNNLQIIASLLSLQAGYSSEQAVQRALADSQNRVTAMALIHQLLYERRDYSGVDLGEYLSRLGSLLFSVYSAQTRNVALKMDVEPVLVDLDRAAPCGLLVNELMTNSLKHAFPGGRAGTIELSLKRQGAGEVLLAVRDDGVGLPEHVEPASAGSLGMQLLPLLAEQAGARYRWARERGTTFELSFSEQKCG